MLNNRVFFYCTLIVTRVTSLPNYVVKCISCGEFSIAYFTLYNSLRLYVNKLFQFNSISSNCVRSLEKKWLRKLRPFSIISGTMIASRNGNTKRKFVLYGRSWGSLKARVAFENRHRNQSRNQVSRFVRHCRDDPTNGDASARFFCFPDGEASPPSSAHCLFCIQRFDHATLTRLTT